MDEENTIQPEMKKANLGFPKHRTKMKTYTIETLNKGAGLFDHVMRSANEYASHHREMPVPVAVGVVAAAINSGLTAREISDVIYGYFNKDTVDLLLRVRDFYEGSDERFHLWAEQADGTMRISRALEYASKPDWKADRFRNQRFH